MRHMKYLLILSSLLLFISCSKDETAVNPQGTPTAKRTVVVYMAGENNLSDYARADIAEMIKGAKDLSEESDLVVFADHTEQNKKPYILRIKNKEQAVDTLYKYTEDICTADAAKFREVLSRIVTLCPNQEYALVLWGHASGWIFERDSVPTAYFAPRHAYGMDTGDNTKKSTGLWLNIPSMRQALESLGIQWKYIFCDCCCMQSVEVAYELRNVTKYLIASPAEITGDGAPYNTITNDFFAIGDEEIYTGICDHYYAQTDPVGGHLPISVINTSYLPALAKATKAILPAVSNYVKTPNAMEQLIYYLKYGNDKVMYDMNDIIHAALSDQPEQYDAWRTAFNQTVIYSKMSNKWHSLGVGFSDYTITADRFGGISMFVPLAAYAGRGIPYFNETIKKLSWYYAVGAESVGW